MAGGSATRASIGFQDQVAGLLSVHVLADAPVDFFGLPVGPTPISIELETSAPVDDILVGTSATGFCFVNVKKGVTTSTKPDSPLASTSRARLGHDLMTTEKNSWHISFNSCSACGSFTTKRRRANVFANGLPRCAPSFERALSAYVLA